MFTDRPLAIDKTVIYICKRHETFFTRQYPIPVKRGCKQKFSLSPKTRTVHGIPYYLTIICIHAARLRHTQQRFH